MREPEKGIKKGFLTILINNNKTKIVVKQKSPQLIFVKQKIKFTQKRGGKTKCCCFKSFPTFLKTKWIKLKREKWAFFKK